MGLLRKHLIDSHLLDDGYDDDEAMLRLGEAGSISDLVSQTAKVLHRWYAFRQAFEVAEKTNNADYLVRCRNELVRASIELAVWLERRGLFDHLAEVAGNDLGNA